MKKFLSVFVLILMAFASPPVQATNSASVVAQPEEQCFVSLGQANSLPETSLPLREVDIPDYPYTLQLEGWPAMTGSNSSLLLAQNDVPEIEVSFDQAEMTANMRNSERVTDGFKWTRGFLELGLRCPSRNQSLFLQFNKKEQMWTAFVP